VFLARVRCAPIAASSSRSPASTRSRVRTETPALGPTTRVGNWGRVFGTDGTVPGPTDISHMYERLLPNPASPEVLWTADGPGAVVQLTFTGVEDRTA
jgi:hypothetical protein